QFQYPGVQVPLETFPPAIEIERRSDIQVGNHFLTLGRTDTTHQQKNQQARSKGHGLSLLRITCDCKKSRIGNTIAGCTLSSSRIGRSSWTCSLPGAMNPRVC